MEVALYARVSTERQQHAQTIQVQLERLRQQVSEHTDWHLTEAHIYRDDGYSGAKLNRPALDRLRDHAAMGQVGLVLITAPDRLARKYVHQVLLLEELKQVGCQVEFVDRPMSDDPNDQLLLQIRGAVAEYERSLITERMRRGRQVALSSGQMLPWTVPPYGYVLDAQAPRKPAGLRIDPAKAAIVTQIFAWYTDPAEPATLWTVTQRLNAQQIPTPGKSRQWHPNSVRNILCNSAYAGTAYFGTTHQTPAQRRRWALGPWGRHESRRAAPPDEWLPVSIPAIISPPTFAAAQARMEHNKQMAKRNNTQHEYLLRGLVSCARCHYAFTARTVHPGYNYYTCSGRRHVDRMPDGQPCTAPLVPASALDQIVWDDLARILSQPALIMQELARAQAGDWLPEALQARRTTLQRSLAQLERQQQRLLEVFLAEVIERHEFDRKRREVSQMQSGLLQQLRDLDHQAQQQTEVAQLATGIETFCQRLQPTLEHLTFAQRRQLVELLIDRILVDEHQVEIRYAIPTSDKGALLPFVI
jgi:site-specific DNA recombinase